MNILTPYLPGYETNLVKFHKTIWQHGMKQVFSVYLSGQVSVSHEVWAYIWLHLPSLIVALNSGPPQKEANPPSS
jgi:hypothetical protein